MAIDVTSLLIGGLIGVILTIALVFPRIGRILARTMAVSTLALGLGGIVWVIDANARDAELSPIVLQNFVISEPSEAVGWSAHGGSCCSRPFVHWQF